MRRARSAPLPPTQSALALIVAGCVVLAVVNGIAAVGVGACLVTLGLCRLLSPPVPPRSAVIRPEPVPARERIVIERRTRERQWPAA